MNLLKILKIIKEKSDAINKELKSTAEAQNDHKTLTADNCGSPKINYILPEMRATVLNHPPPKTG